MKRTIAAAGIAALALSLSACGGSTVSAKSVCQSMTKPTHGSSTMSTAQYDTLMSKLGEINDPTLVHDLKVLITQIQATHGAATLSNGLVVLADYDAVSGDCAEQGVTLPNPLAGK